MMASRLSKLRTSSVSTARMTGPASRFIFASSRSSACRIILVVCLAIV